MAGASIPHFWLRFFSSSSAFAPGVCCQTGCSELPSPNYRCAPGLVMLKACKGVSTGSGQPWFSQSLHSPAGSPRLPQQACTCSFPIFCALSRMWLLTGLPPSLCSVHPTNGLGDLQGPRSVFMQASCCFLLPRGKPSGDIALL